LHQGYNQEVRVTSFCAFGLVLLAACGTDPGQANVALALGSSQFAIADGTLSFELLDQNQGGAPIGESALTLVHEKVLHAYIFDESLQEFRHEHPTYAGTRWSLPLTLSVNGNYRIYLQGRLTAGQLDFTATSTFVVSGGSTAHSTPPSLSSTPAAADGISQVSLGGSPYAAGSAVSFPITFSRTDSSPPSLGLYLGEYIHAVFVPESGTPLIHVHGMLSSGALYVMATFPTPGMYRGWIQFKDGGTLRTAAVAVQAQ